jgi:hypothetical protein
MVAREKEEAVEVVEVDVVTSEQGPRTNTNRLDQIWARSDQISAR